jgi:plastocyanin
LCSSIVSTSGALAPHKTASQRIKDNSMKTKKRLRHLHTLVLSGLVGGAFGFPLSALAAVITNVSVVNTLTYIPVAVTINAGDTVEWDWSGTSASHSSTSDTGLWDSGIHSAPFSFPFVFTNAGTFPYHCSNPFHTTMKGSVTVLAAADLPPTVTVTNPPDGTVLSAPATVTLAATASDPDGGSVTNVQFFQGTTSLTNVTSGPYSVAVKNLGAGDYTFSAVATDNGGLSATNAIVVHVVTPVSVVVSALQRPSPTSFQFSYSANVGLRYVILRSGDLTGFSPISTNTAASNPVTFLDNGAAGAENFYRVGLLPNP